MKSEVIARARGLCEWCGLPLHSVNVHHRWYPDQDTPRNLMAVHRSCHENIHFGTPIRARSDSLAASPDTGKGESEQWDEYLKNS